MVWRYRHGLGYASTIETHRVMESMLRMLP
jgi:hypothetical protein